MSQPPIPPGPPTQPLPQPEPQPWPLQGMPPHGSQPPYSLVPVQQQLKKPKRFGWPTVIITSVISLFVGMLFAFAGEPTTTAVPEATATVTETLPAEDQQKPTEESTEPKPKPDQPKVDDTISDGMHEVGVDVKAGQYKTSVPEGASCYWERSRDDSGDSTIANELQDGPARQSVTIKKGEFFKTEDCGTWKRV